MKQRDPINDVIELTAEKGRLRSQLSEIEKRLAAAKERVAEQFIEDGTQRVTRDGYTVYISKQLSCKARPGVDYCDIADGLKREGFPHLVSISHMGLKSVIREANEAGIAYPHTVRNMMNVSTRQLVACMKS